MSDDCLIDDAKCDYFAGGWICPTIEELKKDGRWERLSPEKQAWYLKGEQCSRKTNPELAKKLDASAARLKAKLGLPSAVH